MCQVILIENYFLKNIKLQNNFHIFIANSVYTSSRKKEMRQSFKRRERGRIRYSRPDELSCQRKNRRDPGWASREAGGTLISQKGINFSYRFN